MYRAESRRVLATLIRLLGDFDAAEEALHDAFVAAMERWPRDGVPANPRAWLVSTGRFRAIDRIRRRAAHDEKVALLSHQLATEVEPDTGWEDTIDGVADDRLRLVFTCCHPALAADAQVALTLREVCGLTTEEIARAFLTTPSTIAQRIVRAKAKIRDARIPYEVPTRAQLAERLHVVLHVVYLVFSEGYAASRGDAHVRADLCAEAIRLGRLLRELLPEREVTGLVALMLLHDARRDARTDAAGDVVLLSDQDRTRWNAAQIAEGCALAEAALRGGRPGPFALQAAIAAVHAESLTAADTDWAQIVELYGLLVQLDDSPVVQLNRAVAVAVRDGPAEGLALIDALLAGDSTLATHHLAHSARADLLRRLGRRDEARSAYARALEYAQQEPERRFLARRMSELDIA